MRSISKTIAGYSLPSDNYLKGRNYLYVIGDSTETKNASELKSIIDLAKKVNPNNAVKSATNQMTIVVGPGVYRFGNSKLVLNTPFINIISLTGSCDVLIDGLTVTSGNINLKGIDCGVNVFDIADGLTGVVVENCRGLNFVSDSLNSVKTSVGVVNAKIEDYKNSVSQLFITQTPVATFNDLATTYPGAEKSWSAMVVDEGFIYTFNGDSWKSTGLTAFPKDVATKTYIIKKSSSFFLPDSINNIPDGILNFGIVDYIDDGTELYILTIRANIGVMQVAKSDGVAIAQFYAGSFLREITEVELIEIGGTKVLFKAQIDWSLFDSTAYPTWFATNLHINPKYLYTGEILTKISSLNKDMNTKVSSESIYKSKINLFDKNSPLVEMGKWIPSTSITGLTEEMSGIALLTGYIGPLNEGDVVSTTMANQPEHWFGGYYAIFDKDKKIITKGSEIFPTVTDGYCVYTVLPGEKFVRICFRNEGIDLATMKDLMVTVNQRYTGTFIPFGLTNRIDLKTNDIPGCFYGKTIMCCGDSVTEFGTYPEQVAELIGATPVKVGYGGCRMAIHSDANYNELSMYKIATAINTGSFLEMQTAINNLIALEDDNSAAFGRLLGADFSKVDILTIFFGTNDFTGNVPIGVNSDATGATFKGAVNYTINKILSAYPGIRIVFITPTHRFISDNQIGDVDIVANGLGLYLTSYVDAIIEIANINHIPVIDMYRNSGLNKYNHTHYFGVDGVHPNSVGYTYIANRIAAFLKSIFSF